MDNMRPRKLSLAFLSLLFVFSTVSVFSYQDAKSSYEELLERVKKADPSVDFTALRLAYADNPPKGAGDADPKISQSMFAALRAKDYGKAIELAEKILKNKYVDINAHLVASAAYKGKSDAEKEKFHSRIAEGLIQSILHSGDGKSEATAFTVIATDEEYVILRVYGLMPGSQSLMGSNGHHYDKLEATNPKTGEKQTLYFNIDRPYGSLEKLFK